MVGGAAAFCRSAASAAAGHTAYCRALLVEFVHKRQSAPIRLKSAWLPTPSISRPSNWAIPNNSLACWLTLSISRRFLP